MQLIWIDQKLLYFLLLDFSLTTGVFSADIEEVSVMEGDLVTLNTDVNVTQQDRIIWYFNGIRIAQIARDFSKICTDVQCNEGTKRFRDRLKLDHQTGSLTIMNIRITDEGVYHLLIISRGNSIYKIYNVTVHGVSAAEREEMKRKSVNEGESVTLDPGVTKNPNDVMKWYFNETLITEITGDQSKICTDDQCDERFRDRLKLDLQTGSLTIMNTRNTDSGEYKLQINSVIRHRHHSIIISSVKIFTVTVTGSGLSSASVGGIISAVVLLFVLVAFVAVIYYRKRQRNGTGTESNDDNNDSAEVNNMNVKCSSVHQGAILANGDAPKWSEDFWCSCGSVNVAGRHTCVKEE